MNLLTEKLPYKVEIGGVEYPINTDFRTSILFNEIMEDEDIEESEKILKILNLYFSPTIPPAQLINEAIDKIFWFYMCDEKPKEGQASKTKTPQKIYSFKYDSKAIFNSFFKEYNIDLKEIKCMHWWKFKSLFDGLGENTEIKKIMYYRSVDLRDVTDENLKQFYKDMKEYYKLPYTEKENKILDDVLKEVMQYQ